jgi:DNA-binding transcriptional ArsR family regulator
MNPDENFPADVYAWILQRTSASASDIQKAFDVSSSRVRSALHHLFELKLVAFPDDGKDRFVAISPSKAHVELIAPLEREIHDKRKVLSEFQDRLSRFGDAFDAVRRSGLRSEASLTIRDGEQLERRLADAAARCAAEVCFMQSGDGDDTCPVRLVEPHLAAVLRRGIDVRVVAPHTLRASTAARTLLSRIAAAGGRVRTTDDPPENLLVFDRNTAFAFAPDALRTAPGGGADTSRGPGVTVVHDLATVQILGRLHSHVWESGLAYEAGSVGYGESFGAVRRAILKLLATGLKDEVVARRLGMSERTFRRHVAALMEGLGAQSRFQAGVLAAQTGLVDDPAWLSSYDRAM